LYTRKLKCIKEKKKYQENKLFHVNIRHKIRAQKPEDEQKSQYTGKTVGYESAIQSSSSLNR
jgi:hypothetical protein